MAFDLIDTRAACMYKKQVKHSQCTSLFRAGIIQPQKVEDTIKTIIEFADLCFLSDGIKVEPWVGLLDLDRALRSNNIDCMNSDDDDTITLSLRTLKNVISEMLDGATGVTIQFDGADRQDALIDGLQFLLDTLKGASRTIVPGQTWRHFKGGLVKIVTVANHSESAEPLVIYKCESGTYARPLDMFLSEVDHDRYPDIKQRYRFELVTNQEVNDED